MHSLWQLSIRIPALYLGPRPSGARSRCALPTGYRIGGVEALVRVCIAMVSDACGRNGFADASFPSNTSAASVEGLGFDFKSPLEVGNDSWCGCCPSPKSHI